MKLRNKMTGEIIREAEIEVKTRCPENDEGDTLAYDGHGEYTSLAELNEDWEDYKPVEPLIKDEKIRKVVRAWAEVNGVERVWHEYPSCWLRGNGLSIEMENGLDELEQGNYSIDELCGEEEE